MCIYPCVYTYICTYLNLRTLYIYVSVHITTRTDFPKHIHTHTQMHTRMHASTYTITDTLTHLHTQLHFNLSEVVNTQSRNHVCALAYMFVILTTSAKNSNITDLMITQQAQQIPFFSPRRPADAALPEGLGVGFSEGQRSCSHGVAPNHSEHEPQTNAVGLSEEGGESSGCRPRPPDEFDSSGGGGIWDGGGRGSGSSIGSSVSSRGADGGCGGWRGAAGGHGDREGYMPTDELLMERLGFLASAGLAGEQLTMLAMEDFTSVRPDRIHELHSRVRLLQDRWGWN